MGSMSFEEWSVLLNVTLFAWPKGIACASEAKNREQRDPGKASQRLRLRIGNLHAEREARGTLDNKTKAEGGIRSIQQSVESQ